MPARICTQLFSSGTHLPEGFPLLKLAELSPGYQEAAIAVSRQLRRMRAQYRSTQSPETRAMLQHKIAQLATVLTQLHDLAELTQHYYESGYCRNGKYTL